MKIKFNYTNKSFAIALLMTTHMATTPVFCMEGLPTSETIQTTATQSIVMPECIQDSRISFDEMSFIDKKIITRHIKDLCFLKDSFFNINPNDSYIKKLRLKDLILLLRADFERRKIKHFSIEELDNSFACIKGEKITTEKLISLKKLLIADFLKKIMANNSGSRETLFEMVERAMSSDNSLQLIMLGFPGKSANVDDVGDNQRVGLGDFLGLLTLHHITHEICNIVPARFKIISDYAGLHGYIDGPHANIYQEGIKSLVALLPTLEYDMQFHNMDFPSEDHLILKTTPVNQTILRALNYDEHAARVVEVKTELFSDEITASLSTTPHLRFSVHNYKNLMNRKISMDLK